MAATIKRPREVSYASGTRTEDDEKGHQEWLSKRLRLLLWNKDPNSDNEHADATSHWWRLPNDLFNHGMEFLTLVDHMTITRVHRGAHHRICQYLQRAHSVTWTVPVGFGVLDLPGHLLSESRNLRNLVMGIQQDYTTTYSPVGDHLNLVSAPPRDHAAYFDVAELIRRNVGTIESIRLRGFKALPALIYSAALCPNLQRFDSDASTGPLTGEALFVLVQSCPRLNYLRLRGRGHGPVEGQYECLTDHRIESLLQFGTSLSDSLPICVCVCVTVVSLRSTSQDLGSGRWQCGDCSHTQDQGLPPPHRAGH